MCRHALLRTRVAGKRFDLRNSVAQAAALLVASLLLVGGGVFWYVCVGRATESVQRAADYPPRAKSIFKQ